MNFTVYMCIYVHIYEYICVCFCTSTAPPSTGACVFGTGTVGPRDSLLSFAVAARSRVWFGNGVELLLNGAEVSHEGIQINCVTLVQCLCRMTDKGTRGQASK